jgi:uncharacterized lipoprotein YmbA
MKFVQFTFLLFLLVSCSSTENKKNKIAIRSPKKGECPKLHTDNVIPIVYGFPSEEAFHKADSGLVILAGCIVPENPKYYYCKKHKIEF